MGREAECRDAIERIVTRSVAGQVPDSWRYRRQSARGHLERARVLHAFGDPIALAEAHRALTQAREAKDPWVEAKALALIAAIRPHDATA